MVMEGEKAPGTGVRRQQGAGCGTWLGARNGTLETSGLESWVQHNVVIGVE